MRWGNICSALMYLGFVDIDEKVKRNFYHKVASKLTSSDIVDDQISFRDLLIIGTALKSYAYLDNEGWSKLLDFIALQAA